MPQKIQPARVRLQERLMFGPLPTVSLQHPYHCWAGADPTHSENEIEHVQNVIRINQLRYSNRLSVNVELRGSINGAMIIPFVLITLVENAFKHGDMKSQDYPIDIKLKVEERWLYFYCRNKKRSGPKQLSAGIGLENIWQFIMVGKRPLFTPV